MAADGVMPPEPIRFGITKQSGLEFAPTNGMRDHSYMDKVRQNIRRLMGDRSVKEVGDGSGVGQSWLQRYLNPDKASGIQDARHAKLALLAGYFGVSVGELTGEPGSGDASQAARPDFEKMGNAVTVLREYLGVLGKPVEWLSDPVLLETSYLVVEEFGAPVTRENVIDLTKRLGQKVREGGLDEQRQVQGASASAG